MPVSPEERFRQEVFRKLIAMTSDQVRAYRLWRKTFGVKFSLWAAEHKVWHPEQKGPTINKAVIKIFEKRKFRIKYYMKEDHLTLEDAVKQCDKEAMMQIAYSRMKGNEVQDSNIFYEMLT